jgi:peptidyl-prolyl cis-trans isomerase D
LLESFRRGQRWLTFIFVSVIGLVFVFFLGVGGSFGPTAPRGNAIVQIDDLTLTERDFARVRRDTEERLRAQFGDQFEQLGDDRASQIVASEALGSLVNSVVLATAAEELGLLVTKEELRRAVQSSPGFRDESGRFSPEAFDNFATYEFGSQRAFIETFTRDRLGQKLIELLVGQTRISDAEIDLRARYELEEVRLAYVALATDRLPPDEILEAADVEAWAGENAQSLEALYEERAPQLAQPDRVRARHILILTGPEAGQEEETALSRAEAARARILGGEAFEDVAAELSEDAATSSSGGDLGLFARGENDPALDEAAFGLPVGELSEPIRSSYGFHLFEVQEKLEASTPSFEELRLELAREEAEHARGLEWATEKSEALADAIESGSSLEDAAREHGLTLERPPTLKRRPDGYVPGLGAAADVLTTAFTLDAGQSSPMIFDLARKRVLIQVLEHTGPSEEELAETRGDRRAQLEIERQNQVVQAWLDHYRRELEASGRLRINAALALGA